MALSAVLLALCAGAVDSESWAMFRGGPFRDGYTSSVGPTSNGTAWKFLLRTESLAPPTVHPDGARIYVGAGDGLYCVKRDGTYGWFFEVKPGVVDSAPAVDAARNLVIFGGMDGVIYALNARTGRQIWSVTSGKQTDGRAGYVFSSVVLDDRGVAYVGAADGALRAIATEPAMPDGVRVLWSYDARGEPIWSSPALSEDQSIVYVGGVDNYVHAVSTADGTQLWEFEAGGFPDDLDDPDVDSSPAVSRRDGTVFVGSFDNRLHALDGDTGALKWSYATKDNIISSPALSADASIVYVSSMDGAVHAVDAASGRRVWAADLGSPIYSEPVVDGNGVLFAGADDGNFYALDAATGAVKWAHAIGDKVRGEPAVVDGRIYVVALNVDPFLHCIGGPTPPPAGERGGAAADTRELLPVVAATALATLGAALVILCLAAFASRYTRSRSRQMRGHALLSQQLIDDVSPVSSFVELSDRAASGNGPLTRVF